MPAMLYSVKIGMTGDSDAFIHSGVGVVHVDF